MTQRDVWKVVFVLSCVFIIAGGLNSGFSRIYMSIPFMVIALVLCISVFKKLWLTVSTALLILFSFVVCLTLERNSVIFPVLKNGEIEILEDSFHAQFRGGSGGLVKEKYDGNWANDIVYKPLSKGSTHSVVGVKISPSGFSNTIGLITDFGVVSQNNYSDDTHYSKKLVEVNKTVHSPLAKGLSFLMVWPIIFIVWFPAGILTFLIVVYFFKVGMDRLPKSREKSA